MLRCCEDMHLTPDYLDGQPFDRQAELLAFAHLRRLERVEASKRPEDD